MSWGYENISGKQHGNDMAYAFLSLSDPAGGGW
jgi:hypothetical protein